jgi:hypothetical protein
MAHGSVFDNNIHSGVGESHMVLLIGVSQLIGAALNPADGMTVESALDRLNNPI